MRAQKAWSHRPFWQRLALLAATAMVAAFAIEALLNYRAFATAGLTPVSLYPEDFSSMDDSVTIGEDGIRIDLSQGGTAQVLDENLNLELQTVSATLSGQGQPTVDVLIEDEAGACDYQQEYSVVCVASDPALATFTAPVDSAGEASALCLSFTAYPYTVITLESVTVNAPIPFQWQPVRLSLSFAVAFALLCAFLLRGFDARFAPEKRSHRLIVAVPLLALMLFSYAVASWIAPETRPFSGMTDSDANTLQKDAYAVLFETLRTGELALPDEPDEDLLSLNNPYDPSERTAEKVSFRSDYALYGGHYYVYFGLAPVLTVYAPFHALTGRVPTSRDAALLLSWLAILFIGWAVVGLARRVAPGANVFAVSLCAVAAVFSSGVMFLMASADFYYVAELSFVCWCAGSIAAGLQAPQMRRAAARGALYALCGVCFVLATSTRPNAVPLLAATLAPLFIADLVRRRASLRDALLFLIPAVAGVGLILLYNAARFGSAFDFGITHQLTVSDVHYRALRLSDLPQALIRQFFDPLAWSGRFPYLLLSGYPSPMPGHVLYDARNAGVLVFPITWALFLMPLSAPRGSAVSPLLRRERRFTLLLPLALSVPVTLLGFGLAGVLLRYTCDVRLFFTLSAVCCALPLLSDSSTPERRALRWITLALCVASLLVGVSLVFDNERKYILDRSPQIYYALQRMFYPYV